MSALDAQSIRRAAATAEMGRDAGLEDVERAARAVLTAHPDDREAAENDLPRTLRAVTSQPGPDAVLTTAVAGLPGPEVRPVVPQAGHHGPDVLVAVPRQASRPGPEAMLAVAEASRRLALARQVHSDLVRDALAVRRRLLVRMLRLARKHPLPRFFDIDDPTVGDTSFPARRLDTQGQRS